MTALALEIGTTRFAACRVAANVGEDDIRQVPLPAGEAWNRCKDLLVEVAAGDTVTAVGIATGGPIDMSAGVAAPADVPEWRTGFDIVEAVQKLFPSASVHLALDGVCLA